MVNKCIFHLRITFAFEGYQLDASQDQHYPKPPQYSLNDKGITSIKTANMFNNNIIALILKIFSWKNYRVSSPDRRVKLGFTGGDRN